MPGWWKGKGKSRSSNSIPGSSKKKAGSEAGSEAGSTTSKPGGSPTVKKDEAKSFDEAKNFHAGTLTFVFGCDAARRGHPLPRPEPPLASTATSLPHDRGAASASASASSVSSSGSSDETPDLGFRRCSEPFNMPRGRSIMPSSHRQQHVAEDMKLFSQGPVLEHERLPNISVSPRKVYSFDAYSNGNAFSQVGASKSAILNPLSRSPGPGFRGYTLPTSPVHPRNGMTPGSPIRRLDDPRSPHPLPLPPGSPTYLASQSLQSQWKKGKLIGRGTFGNVYEGFNSENGQMCAIKEVKLISDDSNSKECLKQLAQEITLLSQLSHPNIVRYFGSELGEDALSVYLEFLSGGSIHKLLQQYGPFKEPVIRSYAGQILAGLAYLHGRNTVHRDIKGANILVDPNGEIKLADFGMAKHISSITSIRSFKGSPYWMAPEVIMNTNGYNLSVDIWSLGCTILEMATSKPPWSEYEGVAAIFKIGNSKDIPEIPDHISNDGKSFLKLCLQRDPSCRATAAQLMEHPFVRDQPTIKLAKADLSRDNLCYSPNGNRPSTSTNFRHDRSTSLLHEKDNWMRHTIGFSPTLNSPSDMVSPRMNLSLPVSPCSSPLRQIKQNNWSCLPSPPHPAYTVGTSSCMRHPLEPKKSYQDPWPDIFHVNTQRHYGSPRR